MATRNTNKGVTKTIKIAQINAQNSRLAVDEIRKTLVNKCIDAIPLQEPYNWRGKIRGLGITTKIIKDTKVFNKKFERNNIKSAIAVPNLKMKTLKLQHLYNSNFSCAEIGKASTNFTLLVYICNSPNR